MFKEIILLLVFLFIVIVAIYQSTFYPITKKESASVRAPMQNNKIDKKQVNFAEYRTERVFNKSTGSVIEERISMT